MNILRTIQAGERPTWVAQLFEEERWGRPGEPSYPPMIPLPFRLQKEIVRGSYLYLVYRSAVIGYAVIREVLPHQGSWVGSEGDAVAAGDAVYAEAACKHMPKALKKVPVQGFQGVRYTSEPLHDLEVPAYCQAIKAAGIRLK